MSKTPAAPRASPRAIAASLDCSLASVPVAVATTPKAIRMLIPREPVSSLARACSLSYSRGVIRPWERSLSLSKPSATGTQPPRSPPTGHALSRGTEPPDSSGQAIGPIWDEPDDLLAHSPFLVDQEDLWIGAGVERLERLLFGISQYRELVLL